jgi:hypothetical protein
VGESRLQICRNGGTHLRGCYTTEQFKPFFFTSATATLALTSASASSVTPTQSSPRSRDTSRGAAAAAAAALPAAASLGARLPSILRPRGVARCTQHECMCGYKRDGAM